MADNRSILFISDKTGKNTPDAFRQVENWSRVTWYPITGYLHSWASTAPIAQWCIDGFGFVHFRGTITNNVALGSSDITTVPRAFYPVQDELIVQRGFYMTSGNYPVIVRINGAMSTNPGLVTVFTSGGASGNLTTVSFSLSYSVVK